MSFAAPFFLLWPVFLPYLPAREPAEFVAFPSAYFVSDRTTVLMITLPIPPKPPRLLFYKEVGGSGVADPPTS